MSFERGGRGEKDGNRYEDRFFAKLILSLWVQREKALNLLRRRRMENADIINVRDQMG